MNYYKKWKQFLKESVLSEAAKGIGDLNINQYIKIVEKDDEQMLFKLMNKNEEWGSIRLQIYDDFAIIHSGVEEKAKGWGPFLYDLGMQIATEVYNVDLISAKTLGILAGSTAFTTTPAAEALYKFYYENREDVDKTHVSEIMEIDNETADKLQQIPEYLSYAYTWVGEDLIRKLEDLNKIELDT